jgi:GntR family transcriptional regulator / MocR family aminotransferase
MGKNGEPLFQLDLTLPQPGSRARRRELHRQLRDAILDGRLQPGLRLPPTRELAQSIGVSRNTVMATYDLLLSEGYLGVRRGSGTYVAQIHTSRQRRMGVARVSQDDPRLNASWKAALAAGRGPRSAAPRYDFTPGLPDLTRFPFELWRRLSARSLRALSKAPASPVDTQGQPALREGIARHVSFARAVACSRKEVLVTSGAQQAFDLIGRVLVTPKRTVVAVEDPGYAPLRAAFMMLGAKVVPVPMDAEGIIVERIPPRAKIICVTPSHQFPLGTAMSLRRRIELLDFARQHGSVIIEDDYDGEYRYGPHPLDALQTLDHHESVFYVGNFGKCLFPAVRVGFIVAPPWAMQALVATKECTDWHAAGPPQDVLAAFIAEGHLARHLRKMRGVYAERRDLLLRTLARDFPGTLEAIPSAAGLHLSARTHSADEAASLVKCAWESDVGVYNLKRFYLGRVSVSGILFGFGAISACNIEAALARLRRAWRQS